MFLLKIVGKINKMEKNNLENKGKEKFISRFIAIYEISTRNALSFQEVLPIYIRANYKIYSKDKKINKNFKSYNPLLEEKVFELTERYFDRERVKDLKEMLKAR